MGCAGSKAPGVENPGEPGPNSKGENGGNGAAANDPKEKKDNFRERRLSISQELFLMRLPQGLLLMSGRLSVLRPWRLTASASSCRWTDPIPPAKHPPDMRPCTQLSTVGQ